MSGARPTRLGLIGAGIAARELHWPALSGLRGEFEIVAVCSRTEAAAQSLARTVGTAYGKEIPHLLDYREVLALPDVEAVTIALPVEMNREVCAAAAAAGKHVLVEKPIAENELSAHDMLGIEKAHRDLVFMVAENFRYRPVFTALRDAIRAGAIGTPYFVEWRVWDLIDPADNPYARTSWRIHHRYEGGFVTDAGVHNIAALRDTFGDLESLGSASACVNPRIGRTDALAWLFRGEGSQGIPPVFGTLLISFSAVGVKDSGLTVLGSHGTAAVNDTTLRIHGASPAGDSVSEHPDDGGYVAEYLDFRCSVLTGRRPKSTLAEAAKDLVTILGALRSASHGGSTTDKLTESPT